MKWLVPSLLLITFFVGALVFAQGLPMPVVHPGGGSGSTVVTNSTLTGKGTASNPLGVNQSVYPPPGAPVTLNDNFTRPNTSPGTVGHALTGQLWSQTGDENAQIIAIHWQC